MSSEHGPETDTASGAEPTSDASQRSGHPLVIDESEIPEKPVWRYVLEERWYHVIALVATVVAVLGFYTGVRPMMPERTEVEPELEDRSVRPDAAPRYKHIARSDRPTEDVTRNEIRALQQRALELQRYSDTLLDPMTERREQALAERASRRAYSGAPPVIPHPAAAQGGDVCLTCHETGFEVGHVTVPGMSHEMLTQCTQCHAPSVEVLPPTAERLAWTRPGNDFDGLDSPVRGVRAWPGAPPTIPHRTNMRSECLSCHAPTGRDGLQSSHPWRQSCEQCHVPSATLEQMPRTRPALPPVGEASTLESPPPGPIHRPAGDTPYESPFAIDTAGGTQ